MTGQTTRRADNQKQIQSITQHLVIATENSAVCGLSVTSNIIFTALIDIAYVTIHFEQVLLT